jgi:hypothetical protein
MKKESLRSAAWALGAAALFPLVTSLVAMPGCAPAKEDATDDSLAAIDGQSPYPNIRGGDVKGDKNFAELINKYPEGKAKTPAWAAFWWPYTGNGIASGAYGGGSSHGGGYSPAGKYDAARGGRTNSQSWEIQNHGSRVPKVQGWWGHCNGWCAASALLPEPVQGVKVNGIEFGVADIKGLLAEAGMSVSADFFGNRVDAWNSYDQRRWEDTVPDQYFLVLTNFMGKLQSTVLIDRYTGDQIWNQPLAGYRIKYPTKDDYLGCTGNVCKVNIQSTIWWYNDSGVPATVITPEFKWQDELDPASGAEVVQHRDLSMEVWLDGPVEFGSDGKITKSGDVIVTRDGDFFAGGAWKMGSMNVDANPDYMWVPYSFIKPDPTDDYANPSIDIDWIKAHLLVPGGADDTSVHPSPIATAPSPLPSPSDHPTHSPGPDPWPTSTSIPIPFPTHTTHPVPQPFPTGGHGGGGGGSGGGGSHNPFPW